jgi:nitrogen regulatory protein PII
MMKIVVIIPRRLTRELIEMLEEIGVRGLAIEPGRTSILAENTGLLSFLGRKRLENDPIDIVSFHIAAEFEEAILDRVATHFHFRTPGQGTIFSVKVDCVKSHPLCLAPQKIAVDLQKKEFIFRDLVAVSCIVQRGLGERIARIGLETGVSVPITTFGVGSGFRNKLGLLRITIPAEKEIVDLVVSRHDVDSIMELMIEEGRLAEPGRGFIYAYAIRHGVIDTKLSREKTGQLASIEQIVSAIDSLKGDMAWRKTRLERRQSRRRVYLTGIVDLALTCDQGMAMDLMTAAMEAGAPGATISKVKYHAPDADDDRIPATREICRMVASEDHVEAVAEALEKAGAFGEEAHGMLTVSPVARAFTYRA